MLNTGHAYGSITDTMKIIKSSKYIRKIPYVYKIIKSRLHMNDAYIDVYNPIFETLQELNTIYKLYRLLRLH
jgi:hypothetical protein